MALLCFQQKLHLLGVSGSASGAVLRLAHGPERQVCGAIGSLQLFAACCYYLLYNLLPFLDCEFYVYCADGRAGGGVFYALVNMLLSVSDKATNHVA